jgi:hypothetical protein
LNLTQKIISKDATIAIVFFIFLSVLILPLGFTGDRTDGIFHYLIAKTALKYPSYYFDLWGKPVFTLIAMPFAQFGIRGMHFMNILCAVLTAFLIQQSARKLKMNFTWLVYVLLLTTPVYFQQLYTMMTEPLFALFLAWIIYLYTHHKPASAAFFTSLLPLVRQEGYIMIALLFVIYLFKGYYRFLPHLVLGLLFFSFLGFVFQGDFFILINRHPYSGEDLYGHGTFLHFFERAEIMFGIFLEVAFVFGFFHLLFHSKKYFSQRGNFSSEENHAFESRFFVTAIFAVLFFMAHVIMWWKGIFSSFGLERVMACIVPALVFVALYAVNVWNDFFSIKNVIKARWILPLLIMVVAFLILFSRSFFPPKVNLTNHEAVLTDAYSWVKNNSIQYKKIYFSHPYNILLFDLNPKERTDSDELLYVGSPQNMDRQSLIIWDSDFGKMTRFGREMLLADTAVSVLKTFRADNYEVLVGYKK